MTPDFKRLCEAAEDAYNDQSGSPFSLDCREAIVRAVLMALREPSDAVKKAAEEGTEFYGAGEYISYDAGETIARAVDFILAEPAKA
ncbi:hypothetical protein [Methylobacterium sp. 1973]|uniref:hypothetical protein n=1 Tax=Methylobacterium sp. 1973 TaxID=3156421 RepID=UPI003397F11D